MSVIQLQPRKKRDKPHHAPGTQACIHRLIEALAVGAADEEYWRLEAQTHGMPEQRAAADYKPRQGPSRQEP